MIPEKSKSTKSNEINLNDHQKNDIPRIKPSNLKSKSKRRDKTDLGSDFVAPDGGWAWVVCLASGFTSFCLFTPVQQYGIIYRQRMYDLGFDAKQITTIINSELATAALTGIINGALFRRFTFRQASLAGAVLVFMGILLTAFCTKFWQYFVCFSCLYGMGLGMNLSAMALAVNTYFKNYRRRATGFSSTITGLGPIILPHICTFLLQVYGTQGTILLVAAVSLNAVACALTLQPVRWHLKSKGRSATETSPESFEVIQINSINECKYCQNHKRTENVLFSTQILENDELKGSKYDVIEPGTPMLACANDGCFGSKTSLNSLDSEHGRHKFKSQLSTKSHKSAANLNNAQLRQKYYDEHEENSTHCTCAEELALLQKNIENQSTAVQNELETGEDSTQKISFKEKVIKFFDLDLLTDITFVNLIQGMTVMMFCELNFSFLTPFILASYGYNNEQISLAMSLLAGVDIVVRFTAPFALEKVKLSNNLLFAFGIVILLIGRIFVTIVDSYYILLAIFLVMGFGKGFRTIFAPLIIPTYVPLERLPAASGLQLFLNALFTMAVGPLLGLIADISSYTFTIHMMNLMTIVSLLLWIIEWFVRRILRKPNKNKTAI